MAVWCLGISVNAVLDVLGVQARQGYIQLLPNSHPN